MRSAVKLYSESTPLTSAVIADGQHATFRSLLVALRTRDAETYAHSARVVKLSLRLGRECGLDQAQMRSLEFGSLLHDLGKIGVPDAVLHKPAKLTAAEWELMRQHPQH